MTSRIGREDDGYVMPTMLWLMVGVLMLMSWMYDGGRLISETRHVALVADTAARHATQHIDLASLRYDSDPELAGLDAERAVDDYLASIGLTGSVIYDPYTRTVEVTVVKNWEATGVLRALGTRQLHGRATGVAVRGIEEQE